MQAVDFAVLLAGGVISLALVVGLFRSGAWRNPLAGLVPPAAGQHAWPATAAGLLAWVLGTRLVALALLPDNAHEAVSRPGTHEWHVAQTCDALGKLLAAAVMAAFLIAARRRSVEGASRRPLRPIVVAGVVACGALATTSVTVLQLYAGKAVWLLFQPDVVQPVHPVLTALKESAWNARAVLPWGTFQLWGFAVVVAPLAEELFFRGVLLAALFRTLGHTWLSIVFSSLAFGVIHGSQPQDVLPLTVFGAALGFIRVRYRSLPACMLIHGLFNLRTMVQATLAPELIGP